MNLYARLSIGQLAERTGVPVTTLRAWERRHGFPRPERLPSGHRRYLEGDVATLRQVAHERRQGIALVEALRHARGPEAGAPTSLVATVRTLLAPVAPVSLSLTTMTAISHAVEDEAAARTDQPLVIGTFQTVGAWERAAPRWRDLAASCVATIALAPGLSPHIDGRLHRAPIADGVPAGREWAVICDAPSSAVCVVATERPGGAHHSQRRFDALWTAEPAVVRAAARVAAGLAGEGGAGVEALVGARLETPPVLSFNTVRSATGVSNRILEYLDKAGKNRRSK